MLRVTNQTLAHRRIAYAVGKGRIPRAATLPCTDCRGPAIEYDHHLGYEPEHWLSVQPVCQTCHTAREIGRGKYKRAFKKPVHGRVTTYANWGCKCDPCRSAMSEYRRSRRRAA